MFGVTAVACAVVFICHLICTVQKYKFFPYYQRNSLKICMIVEQMLLLPVLPVARHEEEEDGEYLETADEHIGAHKPFACGGDASEGAGRACGTGGRADVAQHTDAAAQCRIDIGADQRVAGHGKDYQQDINEDEGQGLTHFVFWNNLLADTHTKHGSGVKHLDEFVEGALRADDDTDDLDAACRAAGTGADCHYNDRRHPERSAPRHVVELLRREAGARRH